MKLTYGLDKLEPVTTGRAITVGTFDGVHVGHQQILRQVAAGARTQGLTATAVSFEPHPLAVLRPEAAPLQLSSVAEKAALMRALGLDELVVLPFTPALAAMAPEDFAGTILAESLRARLICEGWNFRFGRGGAGTPAMLAEAGKGLGFAVEVVDPIHLDGQTVSSTLVRDWLAAGDVTGAWQALGRPYRVVGEVIHGDARGRQLGFRTANVHVPAGRALPGNGVYAVAVQTAQAEPWLPAMANLGRRPTFAGDDLRLEVHIIDGEHELYGAGLTVAFLERLRPEQKFSGPDALIAQLHKDRQAAETVWQERGHALASIYSPLPM